MNQNKPLTTYQQVQQTATTIQSTTNSWNAFDQKTWDTINSLIQAIDAFGKTAPFKMLTKEQQTAVATGAMSLWAALRKINQNSFSATKGAFSSLANNYVVQLQKFAQPNKKVA